MSQQFLIGVNFSRYFIGLRVRFVLQIRVSCPFVRPQMLCNKCRRCMTVSNTFNARAILKLWASSLDTTAFVSGQKTKTKLAYYCQKYSSTYTGFIGRHFNAFNHHFY